MKFYSFDLGLNPMNLVLELNLDSVKVYVYTENEIPSLRNSVIIQ